MQNGPLTVLIAPLDWGLGHATRCIPIINELIAHGVRVMIAASGSQKALLKQEFPGLDFLDIPGYKIRYQRGVLLKWGLIFRIPAILNQIKKENQWLETARTHHQIDAVISDNRFGLYNENLYTVFMTHQLSIQSGWNGLKTGLLSPESQSQEDRDKQNFSLKGMAGRWAEKKMTKWNYHFIAKYSCCWVPDQQGDFNAGGKLSHPFLKPPVSIKYIGLLSRFYPTENRVPVNPLLILISGPEPHRTRFENSVFRQLADSAWKAVVVRGLPALGHAIPFLREDIQIFNHLPSGELNKLLNESCFIVARSGYSTIMDLLKVHKNAILVPTPGQPEQEYLADYMNKKKWMFCIPEKNFNLEKAINLFQQQEMTLREFRNTELKEAVEEFLTAILQTKKTGPGPWP